LNGPAANQRLVVKFQRLATKSQRPAAKSQRLAATGQRLAATKPYVVSIKSEAFKNKFCFFGKTSDFWLLKVPCFRANSLLFAAGKEGAPSCPEQAGDKSLSHLHHAVKHRLAAGDETRKICSIVAQVRLPKPAYYRGTEYFMVVVRLELKIGSSTFERGGLRNAPVVPLIALARMQHNI
jgi:hypothetical protein